MGSDSIEISHIFRHTEIFIMSESESIKANIAFHEKMFFAAIAVLITLVGWMASNYTIVSGLLLLGDQGGSQLDS